MAAAVYFDSDSLPAADISEGCCQNIQVILSTHSPLLLGDVPQQNVIYLRCGGEGNHENVINRAGEGTFGQNIHLLFKDSFSWNKGRSESLPGRKSMRRIRR